jgi:LysM repeat protein
MPALTAPPLRDQVSTKDTDHFELCGEACIAAALGLDVETVVTWLRQHEGGERAVQTGTSPRELIDFCASRRVSAVEVHGPVAQYVARAAARGHYALVLVWSDHHGNPLPRARSAKLHVGGIGHWLLGYGTAGSLVDVMQPWGGRLLAYDLGQGQDQQLGIEINHQVGAGASPAPPSPTREGAAKGGAHTYVVKPGDTLSGIARAQHITLQRLIAANPQIKNPNRIIAGQRLTIP